MRKSLFAGLMLLVMVFCAVQVHADFIVDFHRECFMLGKAIGQNQEAEALSQARVVGQMVPEAAKADGLTVERALEVFETSTRTVLEGLFKAQGVEIPPHFVPLLDKCMRIIKETAMK